MLDILYASSVTILTLGIITGLMYRAMLDRRLARLVSNQQVRWRRGRL